MKLESSKLVRMRKRKEKSWLSCLGKNTNWLPYGICIAFKFMVLFFFFRVNSEVYVGLVV